ncbi:beta-ketoacyl-[acyl-carrier-protein] synthase family protein [Frankia sp. AgKG'84/4]|uniref:beta-ketoacyl-[acyl-carrier-protein] synthase family protein n=1 Tax=Frankia sp. AgKG'84/4 TaxID=573490 RepID=UPI00200CE409|nr:beta-ketoacyl-[acyl-carrier-protein] synthase family protein [Frankia sp. AgKG'84/4]MCL9795869.1 beta-ketoacyl-[acyl-carrier-protein] synthase family protein [Frankia sp. AgKG'84/4]
MVRDRIVVTGIGAMTPLGGDLATSWAGLLAGTSGVVIVEDEWARELPVRLAGRLPVDPGASLPRKDARKLDRCEQMAMVTAREAWADAGRPQVDPQRLAVVIGTGYGGVQSTLGQHRIVEAGNARRMSPHAIIMLMANGPAAWVSIDLGAKAGARTPVSACASGAEAISIAMEMIDLDLADVVVAGGVEAPVDNLPLAAFAQMRALSTRHDDPAAASRPFDADRDGFVLGEGAAVVVLEREGFAAARGARVHAVAAGASVNSDAADITTADPVNQARAISTALRRAGVAPTDVGLVHAHATSTPVGDPLEAEAIAAAIGTHPAVTATKSMTGHTLGAAGAIGAVATICALRDGLIPPVINLDRLDPEIKLDVVTGVARRERVHAAVANAFGFGGHNATLVFTAR